MPAAGRKRGQPEIPEGNIVLVGLMGAGKSCIGRKLAQRLRLPFVDADAEIEKAAGCSISEIFEEHGEQAFRDGERRVIARLLDDGPQVVATSVLGLCGRRCAARSVRFRATATGVRGSRVDAPLLVAECPLRDTGVEQVFLLLRAQFVLGRVED